MSFRTKVTRVILTIKLELKDPTILYGRKMSWTLPFDLSFRLREIVGLERSWCDKFGGGGVAE